MKTLSFRTLTFLATVVALHSFGIARGHAQGFNPAVDYTKSNFANSPNLRKFVNGLPGLGYENQNDLGQYIPVAVPDTARYPGSDYYEIGLKDHNEQMHSDLPISKIRGYYQVNSTDAAVRASHYLGPLIIARRDRAVRLKFVNELGLGAIGNLGLPVDTTVMGAGVGPLGGTRLYTQNRATIHLHGGLTPWISDGTPHQWVTPAGDPTPYKKGVSFQNVPDMIGAGKSIPTPAAGDGMGTFYYPNQQSARLMFYHDHAYGITRLNVYAGEAAGYLLTDDVEEDLISGTNASGVFGTRTPMRVLPDLGGVYHYGIPLVIQDKTFVNDASTPTPAGFAGTPTPKTTVTDPLWRWSTGGNFWFPHEYMPNEDIFDPSGFNPKGRWDYGPFMIPPMLVQNNTLPSPTIIPEAFMDTPIVNGCAYPYVELPPTAVRLRILNACNDRFLNLQLYRADPDHPTEVMMVPAIPDPDFPTWPRDGREGGVPDPMTAGPPFIQIGNECGFLAKVAVLPQQPVDFDPSPRSVTYKAVSSKTLLMAPAVRADVIVDLSSYQDGDTLILYNDAPAPMPLFDSRNDYFTDDPNQIDVGGAPTTPIGFGPNTRTIMQIRIKGTPTQAFDLAALQAAIPAAFRIAQDPPLVAAAAYNAAYGTNYTDIYANSVDESLNLTGTSQSIAKVIVEFPGIGYVTAPRVSFFGGGGSGATATASLNGITAITLVTAGSGYTTPPAVTFSGGGGTGATAVATVSGGVVSVITVTDPGSGYTTAPLVRINGGGGTGATATATITLGSVGSITLTNPGSGYTSAPRVYLNGGSGIGAGAAALLNGALAMTGKTLVEGFDMEYGRMNAVLGSVPNPMAPTVGAAAVVGAAFYVDPPSEILTAGETVLWRLSHVGVDSHAIHFHLFNVQVVNRVDWTNTVRPPYEDEIGWKETIRTNPFEDIILAIRPMAMRLPFSIPQSNRLLDPTSPAGSTAMFTPVAPPPGLPAVAGTTNVMTNFGWEYVWHCHLLGHEENDMMRPLVFVNPPPAPPSGVVANASSANAQLVVNMTWVDNSTNETGFTIQRATNSTFTTGVQAFNWAANATTYTDIDPGLMGRTRYYYRICAWNSVGNSAWSNVVNLYTPAGPPPAAPTNLTPGTVSRTSVVLSWTDNATNETSFVIHRALNSTFTSGFIAVTINAVNLQSYTRTNLTANRTYYFRVCARNSAGNSAWSNVLTVRTLP
ncbi:MAG: fibronectin type III domain-containing protein [Planctomycetes bacterium]|nr:fibronectin type III domain-containing protein [Planctomycetota bacterium]